MRGFLALGLVSLLWVSDTSAQETATGLDGWMADLERMANGVWITSNAAYADEDGGTEEYGMAFTVQPGGVSATGCLWGERNGEVEAVYWRFFQGWDPVRGAGLVYQAHPTGLIGLGHVEAQGEDEPELVQDFVAPDGTTFRAGHFERWDGPDTRVTRSVDFVDGAWQPRRSYTWLRSREHASPCRGFQPG